MKELALKYRTQIAITLVLLVVIVLIIIGISRPQKVPYTEPEKSAPSIGLTDPTNSLYYAFTQKDFIRVRAAITQYIIKGGGTGNEFLEIDKVTPAYRGDDTVTIEATLPSTKKKLTIIVKIPSDGSIATLSIPSEDYLAPLPSSD